MLRLRQVVGVLLALLCAPVVAVLMAITLVIGIGACMVLVIARFVSAHLRRKRDPCDHHTARPHLRVW